MRGYDDDPLFIGIVEREHVRLAIYGTTSDTLDVIIINSKKETYARTLTDLSVESYSNLNLFYRTFFKLLQDNPKFINLDLEEIMEDFEDHLRVNGSLYDTKIRERFIFLSCLFVSNSIEDAYQNYFQTEKRCVIRDYWQYLIYEAIHRDSLDDTVCDMSLDYKSLTCYVCTELGIIIPTNSLWDKDLYLFEDYGFDPKDGVWKRLKYIKLPCQQKGIRENYNLKTCEIYEFDKEHPIYKYFKLQKNHFDRTKAIIPIELGKLIIKLYKDIKEYYEFLNNENKALSVENIIEEDEELEELLKQAINNKEQKYLIELITETYFPEKKEQKDIKDDTEAKEIRRVFNRE